MARTLTLVLVLATAGVGAWYLAPGADSEPPAGETGSSASEPRPEPDPLQVPVEAGRTPPAGGKPATDNLARFSTGVSVRPLNGVTAPVKLRWPADAPWSPVLRKVVDDRGMEWYLHENGFWSTTLMAVDKVNDQLVPTGLVCRERPALPLVTDEGQPRVTPGGIVK